MDRCIGDDFKSKAQPGAKRDRESRVRIHVYFVAPVAASPIERVLETIKILLTITPVREYKRAGCERAASYLRYYF